MTLKPFDEVLDKCIKKFMPIHGVVGIAQGLCNDSPCIKVYVLKITDELRRNIPENIEGYIVEIEETGEIRAIDTQD